MNNCLSRLDEKNEGQNKGMWRERINESLHRSFLSSAHQVVILHLGLRKGKGQGNKMVKPYRESLAIKALERK